MASHLFSGIFARMIKRSNVSSSSWQSQKRLQRWARSPKKRQNYVHDKIVFSICYFIMYFQIILCEQAHLCSLFCDCQELDYTFDCLIMRAKIPEKRCEAILEVTEDRLRIPWSRSLPGWPHIFFQEFLLKRSNVSSSSWQSQKRLQRWARSPKIIQNYMIK